MGQIFAGSGGGVAPYRRGSDGGVAEVDLGRRHRRPPSPRGSSGGVAPSPRRSGGGVAEADLGRRRGLAAGRRRGSLLARIRQRRGSLSVWIRRRRGRCGPQGGGAARSSGGGATSLVRARSNGAAHKGIGSTWPVEGLPCRPGRRRQLGCGVNGCNYAFLVATPVNLQLENPERSVLLFLISNYQAIIICTAYIMLFATPKPRVSLLSS
ncbi:uncharacterized protein LOC121055552 [Oryza brachyantha]|uniref:uncharacterized protein LOC121055552 n=1 Tax=Oryza brachyantha TaxID=4533 RepID=UPI001ADC4EEB|nr:uncharacterized protein LOC121055552 [Oryza brachyantha]